MSLRIIRASFRGCYGIVRTDKTREESKCGGDGHGRSASVARGTGRDMEFKDESDEDGCE